MSSAATPLLRIPAGVVVERCKADSPWIDFVWRGIGVLPDEPEMEPWTVLREQDEATLYYAGSATVDLYRSETQLDRDNLATGGSTPKASAERNRIFEGWPPAPPALASSDASG